MRHIERLQIPEKLRDNQAKWQADFDAKRAVNPKVRPVSNRYAHDTIKNKLMCMSHNKCFYCEKDVQDNACDVDHYIEVAVHPSKAYEWNNLYIACKNCNYKEPHDSIPVNEALNPCADSDDEIRANVSFDTEIMYPVNKSVKGEKTIRKFRLNSDSLVSLRRNWIIYLDTKLFEILGKMAKEKRKQLNEEEIIMIKRFMDASSQFSLMSELRINSILRQFNIKI